MTPKSDLRQYRDESYRQTAQRLYDGLAAVVQSYAKADDPQKQQVYQLWNVK